MAIEQGRIKFNNLMKQMKVDGHPFRTNLVEVNNHDAKEKAKVLTSDQANQSGVVDPQVQVLADELRTKADTSLARILEGLVKPSHRRCL